MSVKRWGREVRLEEQPQKTYGRVAATEGQPVTGEQPSEFDPFMQEGQEYYDEIDGVLRVNCGRGKHNNPTRAEFDEAQRIKEAALQSVRTDLLKGVFSGVVKHKMGESPKREPADESWKVLGAPRRNPSAQLEGDVEEGEWRPVDE